MPGLALSLIDDAAVFPPGNAPLADASPRSYDRAETASTRAVGPLLVPASAVDTLRTLADPARILDVALIGDTGLEGLVAARDALEDDAWINCAARRATASRRTARSPSQWRRLLDALAFTVPTYLELPDRRGARQGLAVLAADGAERAKFRTGPYEVPSPQHLARRLGAASGSACRSSSPVAFTTHCPPTTRRAARNTTGSSTSWRPRRGDDGADDYRACRAPTAPTPTAPRTPGHRRRRRHPAALQSFGSCSIDEPYEELVRFGVLEES